MLLFSAAEPNSNRLSVLSVYLQTFLYYDSIYLTIMIPFQLAVLIFKFNGLQYTTVAIILEALLVVAIFFVNMLRVHLGVSGNKGIKSGRLIAYLVFALLQMAGHVYLFQFQQYVYWIEFLINIMAIALIAIGFILGIVVLIYYNLRRV